MNPKQKLIIILTCLIIVMMSVIIMAIPETSLDHKQLTWISATMAAVAGGTMFYKKDGE